MPSSGKPQPSPLIHDGLSLEESAPAPQHGQPQQETTPQDFDIDGNICNNLWTLQDNRSLPELTDLCAPSHLPARTSSFTHPRDTAYELTPSGDTAADLSHFLGLIGPPFGQDENAGASIFQDFSPSTIVRSYPPIERQPSPRDFMSISRPLNNPSWTLVEYYFKEVAALFSSYDSQMNPFRTTVSRLWGSSLAMCRTMQSMAAATLVNDFPQFGPIGRKMRDEAVDIITREAVMDDKALLALLMLGQTASWHDPKDLGISFFNLLRKQLRSIGSASGSPGFGFVQSSSNNYRFFEEALIYWEMLLSFVADNDAMMFSEDSQSSSADESFVLQRVPHPWTGIARDTQFTVHEVGRLVRRERQRVRSRNFTSRRDIEQAQIAIGKAQELEERLLNLAHPTEAEIVSPGDDETPVWHLLTMAEVYRCTGLMQLYRVFPDLLRTRLQNPESSNSTGNNSFFPVDLDSMNLPTDFSDPALDPGQEANHNHNNSQHASSPHNINMFPPISDRHKNSDNSFTNPEANLDSLYDAWLTDFALTILSRLKTIPLESRTRCLQPILLVASCSELRLPRFSPSNNNNEDNDPKSNLPHETSPLNTSDNASQAKTTNQHSTEHHPGYNSDTPNISMEAIEVSRTRKFILGRLTSFQHVLPPKPINVCLRLVEEVWKRMDAGEPDVYWIDVMIENGWETTMG